MVLRCLNQCIRSEVDSIRFRHKFVESMEFCEELAAAAAVAGLGGASGGGQWWPWCAWNLIQVCVLLSHELVIQEQLPSNAGCSAGYTC
jgi:hypothetical protein